MDLNEKNKTKYYRYGGDHRICHRREGNYNEEPLGIAESIVIWADDALHMFLYDAKMFMDWMLAFEDARPWVLFFGALAFTFAITKFIHEGWQKINSMRREAALEEQGVPDERRSLSLVAARGNVSQLKALIRYSACVPNIPPF